MGVDRVGILTDGRGVGGVAVAGRVGEDQRDRDVVASGDIAAASADCEGRRVAGGAGFCQRTQREAADAAAAQRVGVAVAGDGDRRGDDIVDLHRAVRDADAADCGGAGVNRDGQGARCGGYIAGSIARCGRDAVCAGCQRRAGGEAPVAAAVGRGRAQRADKRTDDGHRAAGYGVDTAQRGRGVAGQIVRVAAAAVAGGGQIRGARGAGGLVVHGHVVRAGDRGGIADVVGGGDRDVAVVLVVDAAGNDRVSRRPYAAAMGGRHRSAAAELAEVHGDAADGVGVAVAAAGAVVPGGGDGVAHFEHPASAGRATDGNTRGRDRWGLGVDRDIAGVGAGGHVAGVVGDGQADVLVCGIDIVGKDRVACCPRATAVRRRDRRSAAKGRKIGGDAGNVVVVVACAGVVPGRCDGVTDLVGTTGAAGAGNRKIGIVDRGGLVVHGQVGGIGRGGDPVTVGRTDRDVAVAGVNAAGTQQVACAPDTAARRCFRSHNRSAAAKGRKVHRHDRHSGLVLAAGTVVPLRGDGVADLVGAAGAGRR